MGIGVQDRSDEEAAPWGCAGHLHLLLVEIANFAELRRAVGVQRAGGAMPAIVQRITALLPSASVAIAGRDLAEIAVRDGRIDAPDLLAATIHAAFVAPLSIDGEPHPVRLTIAGASAAVGQSNDVALIEQAEAALVTARLTVPAVPSVASVGDEAAVGRELHDAGAAGELFLHYQPKLHLRQQRIASVEALIRWHHPRRGLVMPNDFIPLAERTGAIGAVTLWTLRQVIADQKKLVRHGHDLPVFVNMAGALLSDAGFIDEAIALIEPSGARLGIEITETSVIRDPKGAIRHLQRLADIGVAITIDDYGAGLSSLAYLKQLPASELKIDKLFVTQLTSSHRDPLIVRSTIDLAHALEMEVVAEGVETPASLALLSVMGCDLVQGFLISRPLAMDALLAFLREDAHLAVATAPRSPFERLAAVRARG